ncbi:uncharacterized protein GIQ15_06422 [Arthroderma uncinatum]|uniref:uncharacterized protein n=1 Tax=Arthroderma uncinatum TaxID=74035 RepID=UPI00144ACDAC|nr:uncharacterized protein GIQ15_06422 [Arthroderma uncinatum]KAF3479446.1 hypothetical protein GIQ15_06422 [Arthroderma uncinatum]
MADEPDTSPAKFLHIPNEIKLIIGSFLEPPELNNLIQTTSDLVPLLQPLLHEKAASFIVNNDIPALAWAAQNGREELVEIILRSGKGKIKLSDIILAIFMACEQGYPIMVEKLLSSLPKLRMCSTTSGGKHFFTGTKLRTLTRKARNKYASEDEDLSAHLYVACKNGHEGIARMLLKCGVRDAAKLRALLAIAEEGADEAASIILTAGMSDDSEAISRAILSAVGGRHTNMVKILMNSGAHFEMPVLAYHTAMRHPTSMMDEVLLDLRDGITLPDMTSIFTDAAHSGNYFYIKAFIELGDRCPLQTGVFAPSLRMAAGCPRTCEKLISLIIKAGAEYITKDDLSQALYTIVGFERPVISRVLIQNGADPSSRGENGMTALHTAAMFGHNSTVKVLLDHGADATIKADEGQTALHFAAGHNYFPIARYLIEAGADIDAKDNGELTPLHCAADNGGFEVATLLVTKGVNHRAKSSSGWTALDFAMRNNHGRIVELLLALEKDQAKE